MQSPEPAPTLPARLSRLGGPLLFASAIAMLVIATWEGVIRAGWRLPPGNPHWVMLHGPLMVSAVLGTIISIERAVALGRRWAWLGPLLTALGGVLLLALPAAIFGRWLILLGSVLAVPVILAAARGHLDDYVIIMLLGVLAWVAGNAAWLMRQPVFAVVDDWGAFLVLIIVAERLELARVRRPPVRVRRFLYAAVALLLLGVAASLRWLDLGIRMVAVAQLAMAWWLISYDVVLFTMRKPGLPGYIGVALLSGYIWLALAALMALINGHASSGLLYDAQLHMLFLGFVFAMIFGHMPIILPAITGLKLRFTPLLYLPLGLLHASLLLRVVGDVLLWVPGRQWGSLLNAITLLVFAATVAYAVLSARRTEIDTAL